MNIDKYLKPNKLIVLELSDEVEYLLDDKAIEDIRNKSDTIFLIRLIDRKTLGFSFLQVVSAIDNGGIVDYLDIK